MELGALMSGSPLILTAPEILALVPDGPPADLVLQTLGIDLDAADQIRLYGVATLRARLAGLSDADRLIALRPLDRAIAGIVTASVVTACVGFNDSKALAFAGEEHATLVRLAAGTEGGIEVSAIEPGDVSGVLGGGVGPEFMIWAQALSGQSLMLAGRPGEVAVRYEEQWHARPADTDVVASWIAEIYDTWRESFAA